jgi:hypothetical protein
MIRAAIPVSGLLVISPVLDSYHSTNNGPSLHKGLAPEVIGISSYFAP